MENLKTKKALGISKTIPQIKSLWTRDSSFLLGGFSLVALLVVYFWWPLANAMLKRIDWYGYWWFQFDWLLIGIFTFMSLTIVAKANIKRDALIIFVATCGGLVIEAWGTQTSLWTYYTSERPPLWIIPAWPIATLSIDRITRFAGFLIDKKRTNQSNQKFFFKTIYWILSGFFLVLMLNFVWPTIDKSLTIFALALTILILATTKKHREATLIFLAGAGLGYFLELWGTTRHCWNYYTLETPPLFAILAHGMAALAFYKSGLVLTQTKSKLAKINKKKMNT